MVNKYFVAIMVLFMATGILHGQKMPGQKAFYKKPPLEVDSAFWCARVDDNGRPHLKLSEAKLGSPIFFWVKLKSQQKNALELFNKIENPVVIKWFRFSSYGTSPEWNRETQRNEFTKKRETDALQLKINEINQTGNFTYVTWGSLPPVSNPGVYLVRLVFYDNSPLYCGDSLCEYQIKIEK